MDWFRCYSEFASDSKVQIMPENMQRRLIMLFCLRCNNVLATLHATEIAFSLRISEFELAETKALFIEKGFIDNDWNIQNWDKRQYVSDSSTGRSRKSREKKKTSKQRGCNVAATPPEQNRTDTESKKKNIKKEKQVLPLPDWLPLPEWNDYLEMRERAKKSPTIKAMQLAIIKLDELRKKGNDPSEILKESTMSNWSGLYEPKQGFKNGNSNKPNAHNDFTAGIALALDELGKQPGY